MNFQETIVRTHDGLLKKSVREDRVLSIESYDYRNRKRTSMSSKLLSIEIQLTSDQIVIERVYPNLIDLISSIGGLVKVLVFVCVAVGVSHNN